MSFRCTWYWVNKDVPMGGKFLWLASRINAMRRSAIMGERAYILDKLVGMGHATLAKSLLMRLNEKDDGV